MSMKRWAPSARREREFGTMLSIDVYSIYLLMAAKQTLLAGEVPKHGAEKPCPYGWFACAFEAAAYIAPAQLYREQPACHEGLHVSPARAHTHTQRQRIAA